MRFTTKPQYYLQNSGVLIIGILLINIVNFDWFVKVILIQFLVFAIAELFNLTCYYIVDDFGITLYNVYRKKHIKWSDVLGIIKNTTNNKDSQIIIIDIKEYIKINNSVNNFAVILKLINEKAEKHSIRTDTNKLEEGISKLYRSVMQYFCFSVMLTSISIITALVFRVLALNDLLAISSVIKLSVVLLISYIMAIRFMQQKV